MCNNTRALCKQPAVFCAAKPLSTHTTSNFPPPFLKMLPTSAHNGVPSSSPPPSTPSTDQKAPTPPCFRRPATRSEHNVHAAISLPAPGKLTNFTNPEVHPHVC